MTFRNWSINFSLSEVYIGMQTKARSRNRRVGGEVIERNLR